MSDVELCAHCGQPAQGFGRVEDQRVCHPDNKAFPDCYRLVTVYGEPLGARKVPVIEHPDPFQRLIDAVNQRGVQGSRARPE